jgi:hypothetical protein
VFVSVRGERVRRTRCKEASAREATEGSKNERVCGWCWSCETLHKGTSIIMNEAACVR